MPPQQRLRREKGKKREPLNVESPSSHPLSPRVRCVAGPSRNLLLVN